MSLRLLCLHYQILLLINIQACDMSNQTLTSTPEITRGLSIYKSKICFPVLVRYKRFDIIFRFTNGNPLCVCIVLSLTRTDL
jgi:hypothetical protein